MQAKPLPSTEARSADLNDERGMNRDWAGMRLALVTRSRRWAPRRGCIKAGLRDAYRVGDGAGVGSVERRHGLRKTGEKIGVAVAEALWSPTLPMFLRGW